MEMARYLLSSQCHLGWHRNTKGLTQIVTSSNGKLDTIVKQKNTVNNSYQAFSMIWLASLSKNQPNASNYSHIKEKTNYEKWMKATACVL